MARLRLHATVAGRVVHIHVSGLATPKRFVADSDVFITGRRQSELNAAAEDIGENVTAVVAKLSDLDRPYDIVNRTTEHVDIVFANAALPTLASLREITEQHFDRIFGINVKGLVFKVQKALRLMPESRSIVLNDDSNYMTRTELFVDRDGRSKTQPHLSREVALDVNQAHVVERFSEPVRGKWRMSDETNPLLSDQIVGATALTAAFDAATYWVQDALRDGSAILIRTIKPDDKDRLREHARGLSTESVYHRFMGYKRALTDDDLRRFTELDFAQHVGLVAILSEDGSEHIIGVGRCIRTSNERAEVALSVIDKHQGRGVGTLLLAHLSRIAKRSGITEFEADVMGDNIHMLDVIRASGFRVHQRRASGVVHLVWQIENVETRAIPQKSFVPSSVLR